MTPSSTPFLVGRKVPLLDIKFTFLAYSICLVLDSRSIKNIMGSCLLGASGTQYAAIGGAKPSIGGGDAAL